MNVKVTTALVLLWFMLQAFQSQSVETYAPISIAGESGSCPSEAERETLHQIISKNVSNLITNYVAGRNGGINQQPQCGEGLWTRVAYLNMNDSSQQCPSTWREYDTNGVRACGQLSTGTSGCAATFYRTGQQYRKVCGQVIGYQHYLPQGFLFNTLSINDSYVEGVSITHGLRRNHIWSLAGGVSEGTGPWTGICPCVTAAYGRTGPSPPSFVGDNYYCESAYSGSTLPSVILFTDDPLWDGKNCEGTCCSNGKSPPWFKVDLPNPTNDSIEVRICQHSTGRDTPIKLLELYVQ